MPKTFAALLIFVGAVWIIQGLGITRTGSFMDERPEWAVIGAVLIVVGGVLALRGRRPPQ